MIQFFQTVLGQRFFEGHVPTFIKELKRLNDNLEQLNKNLEQQNKDKDEKQP